MTTEGRRSRSIISQLFRHNRAADALVRGVSANEKLVRLADVAGRTLRAIPTVQTTGQRNAEVPHTRALGALFGPIRVNPHSKQRTDLILRSYVHGTRPLPPSYENAQPVNGSDQEVEQFVHQTVARAREHDASLNHTTSSKSKRFDVVIGERGVGKTFFQNFLLSKYSAKFDEQTVLFVRINLLREFYRDESHINIDHWIKSQIAKVICRYYDSESPPPRASSKPPQLQLPCKTLILTSLEKLPFDDGKVRESARHMLNLFRLTNERAEMDMDSTTVDPHIGNTIFQAVVEKLGMAIIVIVDGLDLLGYTELSKVRYNATLKALASYLSSDTPLYRYHLIFIRPETRDDFDTIISTRLTVNPELDGNGGDYFGLRPVDTRELLRRRFTALSDPNIAEHYKIDLKQLASFNQFLADDNGVAVGPGGVKSYFAALAQLGGHNARCCVQLLQLAYHSYIHALGFSSEEFTKSYQLTEMMMLAGHESPPSGFRYRLDDDGVIRKAAVMRLYESDFLPSIFRAPMVEHMSASGAFHNGSLDIVLLPLRIMQLMQACTGAAGDAGGPVSALTVREHCKELFGYAYVDIQRTLEELIEEELVQPSARVDIFIAPEYQLLTVAPKGRMVLEYFVNDPTYLGLACYNLPLPESMLHGPATSRFFHVARPGVNAQWIVAKIWNSLSLFSIIFHINSSQQRSVNERRVKADMGPSALALLSAAEIGILPGHGGLFTFVDRMETRLLDISSRILDSIPPDTGLHREVHDRLAKLTESVS
jgi:hypothetical protein